MVSADTLNYILALGTVALQVLTFALLGAYLLRSRSVFGSNVVHSLQPFGILVALVISAVTSAFTVYYSAILGFAPCPLCWWQRAFLYPQVLLFLIALHKRDIHIATYSIGLSLIGLGIALYQHALQMLPSSGLPCPASASSCAQRFVFEFGYITFPLMSATVFASLIVLMLITRNSRNYSI